VAVSIEDGVFVQGSAGLLNQLVANAIGNIRRHTMSDVPVRISLHRDGSSAVLVIEDGGPGLADAAYEAGIQHFQRFDPSRSRASGGSGLGMSIMGAIVRKHAGNVAIGRSELGGLRIEVRLPL
jgi:two-component system OmpR family sensor kinase